ncbi:MAG: hypothetical protein Q7U68_04850 [Candidatus Roizmanbacteria bacterium]|nr:hypothetical protein [Candidatus Roizmanbacteria bacterium]
MNFQELWDNVSQNIVDVLSTNTGLQFFAKNRAKFEGWMKVELCGVLSKYTSDIIPEKNRIDIVVENWAIELKTINTNYRCENVENKIRPITKNIQSVIDDINQLKNNSEYTNKAVAFIVFPLPQNNTDKWIQHIDKIKNELDAIKEIDFKFANNIRGRFYLGLIKNT